VSASEHAIDQTFRAYRFWLILSTFLILLVNAGLLALYYAPERPGAPLMTLDLAQVNGSADLCPGELLDYTLDLEIQEAGVFDLDVSVWRVTPPANALFSETRRMVFARATAYRLKRYWQVPATHPDPTTGLPIRWAPGQYERRHAISTVSRHTAPSILVIPFSIRADCPQGAFP
jgi:hypothetical protein